MASYKEKQVIEELNSHNFSNCKFKIEMMLIKEDLFEVVTDYPPTPTTDWTKQDKKTHSLINLNIENNEIVHVKHLYTARDTWGTLKEIHESSNLSNKLYLLRKRYSTKLNESGNMVAHITKILELVDKVSAIGGNITN